MRGTTTGPSSGTAVLRPGSGRSPGYGEALGETEPEGSDDPTRPDPMATAIYDAATVPALPGPPAAAVPGGASLTSPHPHVAIIGDGAPGPDEAFVAA